MVCDDPEYTYMAIDGVENCINALEDIKSGKMENCFVEMSACFGKMCIRDRSSYPRSAAPRVRAFPAACGRSFQSSTCLASSSPWSRSAHR